MGVRKPNAFGLYDMLGNVNEWTEDCRNMNPDTGFISLPDDASAQFFGDCTLRAARGGSWQSFTYQARSSSRAWYSSEIRHNSIGFRVARTN